MKRRRRHRRGRNHAGGGGRRKREEEGGRGRYLWIRRKESAVLAEGDHEVVGRGSGAPGKPAARVPEKAATPGLVDCKRSSFAGG
jgi:hypothetical protein